MSYRCPYCGRKSATFDSAKRHGPVCPVVKERLDNIGLDLVMRVARREMTLEEAEAEQAKRPGLIL